MPEMFKNFRDQFHFPKTESGEDFIYFCGNSLGLQPKNLESLWKEELEKWQNFGVEGHFEGQRPWLSFHKFFENGLSRLTGSLPSEVVAMNGLTVNLNLLLLSFYKPQKGKYKIVIEENAFPSDKYAIQSQVDFYYKNGLLTKEEFENAIVYVQADEWGIYDHSTLLNSIDNEIALVLWSGVNYQTGQVFNIEPIAKKCQSENVVFGVDLAHAIGNVPLKLHDWGIDFAVWCHYKYLNAGPGAVGGAFVHEKNCNRNDLPRLHGWWSNKEENRFEMKHQIDPYQTAEAWQMSNAPVFNMLGLLANLELLEKVNLDEYYNQGQRLSSFLAQKIQSHFPEIQIITPLDQKGCQLSIGIEKNIDWVKELHKNGVIADARQHKKGQIVRLAPVPMYNTLEDCEALIEKLALLLK